jgi:sugar-specific transcriptional regulator TrmB
LIETKYAKTLESFGLSPIQAKTYLVSLQFGNADVKTIARELKVARQEIYRIMPSLQKIGLEEKILGKPVIYRATSLNESLAILTEYQKEKYEDIIDKKKWLIENFPRTEPKKDIAEEDTQLSVVSEQTLFINLNKKLIKNTEHIINIIIPLPHICHPFKLNQVWTHLEKIPHKKDLKVRVITEKFPENTSIPQTITKISALEIRYLTEPVRFGMHIFDDKEMTMTLSPTSGLPSLWSNNPNILKMAHKYFETLWDSAHTSS